MHPVRWEHCYNSSTLYLKFLLYPKTTIKQYLEHMEAGLLMGLACSPLRVDPCCRPRPRYYQNL